MPSKKNSRRSKNGRQDYSALMGKILALEPEQAKRALVKVIRTQKLGPRAKQDFCRILRSRVHHKWIQFSRTLHEVER